MSWYKIEYIVDYIRSKGPLPRDEKGNIFDWGDLLAWYGLEDRLTFLEQVMLMAELGQIVEAEFFVEGLRMAGR